MNSVRHCMDIKQRVYSIQCGFVDLSGRLSEANNKGEGGGGKLNNVYKSHKICVSEHI